MNKKQFFLLLEWHGVDPKNVPDYELFWALYATSFYEKLFAKIDDRQQLDKTYQHWMKNPKLDKRAKMALTFFYNIRQDEMDDPNYWDKVGQKSLGENMKNQLVKESVNHYINESTPATKDDFNRLADELEKKKIPCKIQLTQFGQRTNIDVLCGMDYPDSLSNKVWDAMEATGVDADVSADQAGGTILAQRRIAGGPKRYQRGRRW